MSSSKLAARSSSLLLRHTRLQKTYQKRPSSDSRISPLQRLLIADPDSLHDAQHPTDLLDDHVEYDDDDDDDDDFVDDDDDPEDGADDDAVEDDAVGDDAVDEDYDDAIDDADDDGHHGNGVLQADGKPMESPSVIMTHFQDAVPLDQDNVALPLEDINGASTNTIVNNSAPSLSSPVPAVPAPAIITAVGYHTTGSENNNSNVNGQHQTPVAPPLIPKAKSKDKDVAPPSLSSVNTKLSSKPGLTKKGRSKPQHHHHSYQTYVSSIAKSRPLLNDDLADMFSQLYLEQLPHPTRIRNLTDIGTGSTQQKNLAFLLRINK